MLDKYELIADAKNVQFSFISEGPKGKIRKLIQFTPFEFEGFYNLGFGDLDENNQLDDEVISNNDDMIKILATIVYAINKFTNSHPLAWVYAAGSTISRTRLYKMYISKYLLEAETDFEILGQIADSWVKFEKNGIYDGFLIKRKLYF